MTRGATGAGRAHPVPLVLLLAALWSAGCAATSRVPPGEVDAGLPARGKELLAAYGCGSCHTIPGIRGADALVGPPLTSFGRRSYIAGQLPNNGPNLERWIQDPQAVEPGTAMPDLGVTPEEARDITAYLLTLD